SEEAAGGAAAASAASAPAAGSATEESTAEESAAEDADAAVGDEQFLSDEERVMALLDEEGGRMKQSRIVEETDWSKSKVSMLLTDMEDDDDITKLRVGRENIISLPGNEPEAARSPFDDDE
ncbi:helix-turn-helix domain-containing protein, partial [Halapricum sp. CBA1109]|nr:helix-turn-helix domain-containing protein [Halapricum sp. CBA1109]